MNTTIDSNESVVVNTSTQSVLYTAAKNESVSPTTLVSQIVKARSADGDDLKTRSLDTVNDYPSKLIADYIKDYPNDTLTNFTEQYVLSKYTPIITPYYDYPYIEQPLDCVTKLRRRSSVLQIKFASLGMALSSLCPESKRLWIPIKKIGHIHVCTSSRVYIGGDDKEYVIDFCSLPFFSEISENCPIFKFVYELCDEKKRRERGYYTYRGYLPYSIN